MALRRYQHKFLQPLEIDQERVASSLNTNLTTTNLTTTNSTVTTQTVSKLSTNNFFNSATPDYTPSFEALAILGDPKVSQGAIAHIRNNNVSVNDANVFGGLKFSSAPGADFIIGKATQGGVGNFQVRRENGTILTSMSGSGDLILNTGSIFIGSAGNGISFSATPNAPGISSSLLDEYERGTFTPTLANAGTPTYTNQLGEYLRIGNSVFINVYISYTGATPSSNTRLSGLPFAMTDSAVKVVGWATQNNTGSTVYLVGTTGLSTTQLFVNPLTSQASYGFSASIQITTL